jgi:hypothetical protein
MELKAIEGEQDRDSVEHKQKLVAKAPQAALQDRLRTELARMTAHLSAHP